MSRPRPKRRVAPRRSPVKPREEVQEVEDSFTPRNIINKFQNLSANSQVYYTKVLTAVILGIPSGALYNFDIISLNWWIIPILGLIFDIFFVRFVLKIDESQSSWLKLFYSGTITLFIAFIVVSSLIWMLFFTNLSQIIFK